MGIPKNVGKEFVEAGKAKAKLPERKGNSDDRAARRYRRSNGGG